MIVGLPDNPGNKLICTDCGRSGYPVGPYKGSWIASCSKPHPFKCTCGKAYPKEHIRAQHVRMKRDKANHGEAPE
jgi:hypothetical protein